MSAKYTPSEKDVQRFWNKVDKSGGDDACWLWTAATRSNGYGQMELLGRIWKAHRIAYTLAYGEIPDGLVICHSCDCPKCCNPAHLWAGTHADNTRDMDAKGRRVTLRIYGDANKLCKVSDAKVLEIRERYASGGVTQKALAKEYGVSRRFIWSVVHHRSR